MKILYIQPGQGIGGSKISLLDILRTAPRDQVSYVVLQAPVNKNYEEQISGFAQHIFYIDLPTWQKYKRVSSLEKIRAPFADSFRLLSTVSAALNLRKIILDNQIDIIHTNNGLSPVGAIASFLANRPHIWHIRELIGSKGEYPLILGDRALQLYRKLSKQLICNSNFTQEAFKAAAIPTIVIQNGIDLAGFNDLTERANALRQTLLGDFDGILIGMSGNLTTKLKKHDLFLRIASKVKAINRNCKFIIFGGQTNLEVTIYTKQLRQLAQTLNLEKEVVWADFIQDNATMMGCVDIFVHPASKEGSGRVVMEAMAAGKPVVCARSGGVQELIQSQVNGFCVTPDNEDEFVSVINQLIQNKELRNSIGEMAKLTAYSNYANFIMGEKIQDVYRRIKVETSTSKG